MKSKDSQYTVFISYRRDDTAMAAGRIDDFLAIHFNQAKIFRDAREIGLGNQFPERLQKALGQSRVLIPVIGDKWLTISDHAGRRRIDDPNDWVCTEIRVAIESGITIIPILIGDTSMPKKVDLPIDLQKLSEWQALRVRANTFRYDMLFLCRYLEEVAEMEKNDDHPHLEEIRDVVIEELMEHLFDERYKDELEWIKDMVKDEIIQEHENNMLAERRFDEWRDR